MECKKKFPDNHPVQKKIKRIQQQKKERAMAHDYMGQDYMGMVQTTFIEHFNVWEYFQENQIKVKVLTSSSFLHLTLKCFNLKFECCNNSSYYYYACSKYITHFSTQLTDMITTTGSTTMDSTLVTDTLLTGTAILAMATILRADMV